MLPLGLISFRGLGPGAMEDVVLALREKPMIGLGKKRLACVKPQQTGEECRQFVLSGLELTTAHTGVSGGRGGRRGTDPPGSGPEEVGMEQSPAGFGRRRKKEQLYRVGKGVNKVASGGGFRGDAGMENRPVLLQAMEKLAHEKYFVARTFQRPSPWRWLSFAISLTTSPVRPFSSHFQTLHAFSDDLPALSSTLLPEMRIQLSFPPQTLGMSKMQRGT